MLGAFVAAQDPEHAVGEARSGEAAARLQQQRPADAGAPAVGLDVEGVDLARAGRVLVAAGPESGEADDSIAVLGDDRLGLARRR